MSDLIQTRLRADIGRERARAAARAELLPFGDGFLDDDRPDFHGTNVGLQRHTDAAESFCPPCQRLLDELIDAGPGPPPHLSPAASFRCPDELKEAFVNTSPDMDLLNLIDAEDEPHPPVVTAHDLPDLHEQLLALADRGVYVTDAARVLDGLHEVLLAFPGADPRSVTKVLHEVIRGLRCGPLRPAEGDCTRYDTAKAWLANIRMHQRAWLAEARRAGEDCPR